MVGNHTRRQPRAFGIERGEQGNTLRLNRASLFDIWIAFRNPGLKGRMQSEELELQS